MPSIVGNIKILSVGPSSNVQIGDVAIINLASSSKTYAGANSFNTGDTFGPSIANNQASSTNTNDPDISDNDAVAGVWLFMNLTVNQSIVIQQLRVDSINNSSVLQIGTVGMISALSNLYNTGGFTGPAPSFPSEAETPNFVPLAPPD